MRQMSNTAMGMAAGFHLAQRESTETVDSIVDERFCWG